MLLVLSLNSHSHTQSHLDFLQWDLPGVLRLTFRSIIHSGLISLKHESLCLDFFLACGSSQVALGVKNSSDSAGDLRDAGFIPGSGRSPGGGYGSPLQFSCLENSMDRGAWWATIHRVVRSWTRVKWLSTSPAPFVKRLLFLRCTPSASLLKISWLHGWPLNYAGSPICGFVFFFFNSKYYSPTWSMVGWMAGMIDRWGGYRQQWIQRTNYKLCVDFQLQGRLSPLNPCTVQGSAVLLHLFLGHNLLVT